MPTKRFAFMLVGLLMIGGLSACEKKDGEGPAERAGKEIDKSIDQLGQKMDEAKEKSKEAAK